MGVDKDERACLEQWGVARIRCNGVMVRALSSVVWHAQRARECACVQELV